MDYGYFFRGFFLGALAALFFGLAGVAQGWTDPVWEQAPAWTATVPAWGAHGVPDGVCPFGVSDVAAYRGHRRLDPWVKLEDGKLAIGRKVLSGYPRTVRAYLWCG